MAERSTWPERADRLLLEALLSLNRIGTAVNQISPRQAGSVETTLKLIAESAIQVIPNTSAVIYTYDADRHAFDLDSRVSAGEPVDDTPNDAPRPNGFGVRAITQRRRILSYEENDIPIHPDRQRVGARVMACFPLFVAHQVVGVLYIYRHEEIRFSELELLMLENFVNLAAMAIHRAREMTRVQRELNRKKEELERLRRAGFLISSRLRLEDTLDAILHMAMEVTGAEYGIFRLVDEQNSKLIARAVAGRNASRPLIEALPIDSSSVMGWVAQHRQPLCIHDLDAAPWVQIYRPLYADLKMRSEVAVPLIGASGRLEGVLNLESPQIGAFTEEDSLLLQSLATQAVIAIEEARLLDTLQEMAWQLLTRPCQDVLDALVERACRLLNVAVGTIWIREGDELVLRATNADYPPLERIPLAGSLAGQAVLECRPIKSNSLPDDPRFIRSALAREQGWTWGLVVPLQTNDKHDPIGAFSVYSKTSDARRLEASDWDEKVLTCLGHYAALAVQNAVRQKALREAQERHAIAETFAAIGDIAANALHHLNNKVGTIPVRVQGIQIKCQDLLESNPYLATNLQAIERSATEAMAVVRDRLAHLRPIRPQPVELLSCINKALRQLDSPPTIQIALENLDQLPLVIATEESLTMIFSNLLENAIHALQEEGTIWIRGTADTQWVYLTVEDNGPGIPPELHKRIFELNFSTSEQRGLGFGLWWVKTMMARLGGSIEVESDGQTGTSFRLKLPTAEEHREPSTEDADRRG